MDDLTRFLAGSNPDATETKPAYATAEAYDVRVLVNGDEVDLPFRIHAGRDYAIESDRLDRVASDLACKLRRYYPKADEITAIIRELPGVGCSGDAEPVDLATATDYAW
jgi:hypothetical protein